MSAVPKHPGNMPPQETRSPSDKGQCHEKLKWGRMESCGGMASGQGLIVG